MNLRGLLHIHWALPAGAHGPWWRERCRCGRVRLVRVISCQPVHQTRWHATIAQAQREMLTHLEHPDSVRTR